MTGLFEAYANAWEIWFAGWLHAEGKTAKDLGLAWAGNGGENQLKRAFVKWYEENEWKKADPINR